VGGGVTGAYSQPVRKRTRLGHHGTDVANHESVAHSGKSTFHVGDHVSGNSEAGRASGVIRDELVAATSFKRYIVRASNEEPQYDRVGAVKPRACLCQISDSTMSYRSYCGATPNEKDTCAKLIGRTPMFVIESDATFVAPLFLGSVLERARDLDAAEARVARSVAA
jgi:hypothetical protein